MRAGGLASFVPAALGAALLVGGPMAGVALTAAPQASAARAATDPAAFAATVAPILSNTCQQCHNARLASGGVDLTPLLAPNSILEAREDWETVLRKLRAGEMPPKSVRRPPQADIDALVHFVEGEFEKADRGVKPDPGRVTARRLNRNEYSNTVRDLLGVTFRAENDFPTDDSSYGFDTIGSVLTVSPLLMEKYLSTAEWLAATAVGNVTLPKPYTVEAHQGNLTHIFITDLEGTERVKYDADYEIAVRLAGVRPADAKPFHMGLWVDGTLVQEFPIVNRPAGPLPEQTVKTRLFLAAGDHDLRAAYTDDEYTGKLPIDDTFQTTKNILLRSFSITGPFPMQDPAHRRKDLFSCNPDASTACAEKMVATFGRRAYRRTLTRDEQAALMSFVRLAGKQGQTRRQGVQLALQAMLVSPNFLFRIERDPLAKGAADIHQISNVELASRLSYFLWSSMPDDELLNAAESGRLRTPAVLHQQVTRMLADPKSKALSTNFAGQWLELRNMEFVDPSVLHYPEWGIELRDAMTTETRMFFEHILHENRPLSEFIDAHYTFLNETLAKHYGIAGVTGPEFRKVDLTTDQRGGLLGQGSILSMSSYRDRTSVVLRGKYVLENILGTPPPPPPPDVPSLNEEAVGKTASLRQQMESHRSNPICSSCHSKMDPLGFGLENYDPVGKWRTMDGKFPVDSSGTLPNGKSFTSPAELRKILAADMPNFARCLTEKLLTYALGRGLEPYDRKTVADIDRALAADNYRFQSLIHAIVDSVAFQNRHGEAVSAPLSAKKETDR